MSPRPKTFAEEWAEYERKVVPSGAGAAQRTATRWAFYSGAYVFVSLATSQFSPSEEATPDDIALMERLKDELDAFFAATLGETRGKG